MEAALVLVEVKSEWGLCEQGDRTCEVVGASTLIGDEQITETVADRGELALQLRGRARRGSIDEL